MARAVQLVHNWCPVTRNAPWHQFISTEVIHDTASSTLLVQFFTCGAVEPQDPLCPSQVTVRSHQLSPRLSGATVFGATLLDNWSNTARASNPSREPAKPGGVLVHPYSGHEALALAIRSLAIMNHMTLGKLFNIPASPPHPKWRSHRHACSIHYLTDSTAI